jgi:hypothetical protein
MFAGVTIMHYPPARTEDVYTHIREVLVPHHTQMFVGGVQDALFLVNPENCQGIGIAIWDDPAKLKDCERGTTRDMALAMRDPNTAPTEYAKLRAQWVQDLGGGIVSTDWYEVVGRITTNTTLFPTTPRHMGGGKMFAGVTIMHYPPTRTKDVYTHIREVLVPHHEQMQEQGVRDALFLVNPESCQGIGIAIWDDPAKLKDCERGTTRDMARVMRDPNTAPTEYAKLRAQWVQDLGGGIVSTDWYEMVGRALASPAPGAAPAAPPSAPVSGGSGTPSSWPWR